MIQVIEPCHPGHFSEPVGWHLGKAVICAPEGTLLPAPSRGEENFVHPWQKVAEQEGANSLLMPFCKTSNPIQEEGDGGKNPLWFNWPLIPYLLTPLPRQLLNFWKGHTKSLSTSSLFL